MATCPEPTKLISGPMGAKGADGSNGTNGIDAFTTLSSAFTMPAIGLTGSAVVVQSGWAVIGEPVYLQNAGTLIVTAVPDSTHVTLQNPAGYPSNVAGGTIVALGNKLGPSGFIGPAGALGATGGGVTVAVKGDLQGYSGAPANLAVGANGTRPVADSTQAIGLRYDKVDLSSAAEVKNVLPSANGGNADRLALAGGTLTGKLTIAYNLALMEIKDNTGGANAKRWFIDSGGNQLKFTAMDDAGASENSWLIATRSGVTPTRVDVVPDLYADANLIASRYLRLLQDINTTLVNGNNNDVALTLTSFVKIKPGPSGAFAITGITGGVDGRRLTIYNATGQNMTISHQDVLSTASNRIISTTGSSVATTGDGTVDLIYSVDDQRWIVIASTA